MHGCGINLCDYNWTCLLVTDDYSRVKLLGVTGKGKDTDYINASYIDVCNVYLWYMYVMGVYTCWHNVYASK